MATDLTERQRTVGDDGTPAIGDAARRWTCSRCDREIRVGQQYVTENDLRRHDPAPAVCERG